MSGRYGQWRKLIGDTDRPDLLDVGKKLLGHLEQQRRLSGVKTQSIQRQMPDGSIVRARFDYDIPVIEVLAAPLAARPGLVREIEGFIVRPSPVGDQDENADLNHVLLLFGSTYKPTFYDAAHIPAGLEAGTYTKTFPNGLDYGNVDWRNDARHMQVNWLGPNGRYFGATEGTYGGPVVWCKGRVLFDTREAYASDIGIGETAVQGACLRDRLWLYVVVRTNTVESLVRFRVRSEADAKRARALGLTDIEEHRFADLVIVPDSGEVLASHTIPTNNGVHPWFFNASGTQAKRIDCTNGANGNIEWTMQEDEDSGEWTFSSVQHLSGRTISTVFHHEREVIGMLESVIGTTDSGGSGVTENNSYGLKTLQYNGLSWEYDDSWTSSAMTPGSVALHVDEFGVSYVGSLVRTDTRTAETLPAIVDYRGDEVVYGYGTVGNQVTNYNRSLDERSGSASFTGTAVDGAGIDYAVSETRTVNELMIFSYNESDVRNDEGLTTDFLTVQAGLTMSNVGTESVSFYHDSSIDYGVTGGAPYVTPGPAEEYYDLTQDGTYTEVTDQVELHFLDLRYRHAYLHSKRTTVTKAVAGTVHHDNVGGVLTPSGEWALEQTNSVETRVRVIVNGTAVVDLTDTQASSSGGTVYDGSPARFLWEVSQSLYEAAYTETGATIGYTEDAGTGYFLRTLDRSSGSSLNRGALLSGSAFQMRDTFDFAGSSLFTMGSIVSRSDRFAYSLAGKDTPPTGELPYFNGIDVGELDTLTGDQDDVVRYFPVSYLPRTVIVR